MRNRHLLITATGVVALLLATAGFTGPQLTGLGVHNNVAPIPGTFSTGQADRLPGLPVMTSTTNASRVGFSGACNRKRNDGHRVGTRDTMFTDTAGEPLHPESISQLFARIVERSGLPHIRFHDLRHTHASLLVAAGIPIKVVSERLGHAHPSFTIHTYQHLLPRMSAEAAQRFADLIKPVDDNQPDPPAKHQLTGHRGGE